MTLPSKNITICTTLHNFGKPVYPCATCALAIQKHLEGTRVAKLITIPPAFWNGERYVCEKHMELRNEPKPD